MVARINFSKNLLYVLNYNEQKLKQDSLAKDADGKTLKRAVFIHASGFAKDTDRLGFTDKYKRLLKQMSFNEGRKESVTHISLNFDPSEKDRLDAAMLIKIADTYMEKIGFGNQPYLVYQHHDSGHPHVHIVSSIIRNDGTVIETHKIGEKVSSPARREIERLFGLVVADDHKQKEAYRLKPVDAQKIQYGKSETKRAITNVLDVVLAKYKFTSIAELNAVLKGYNVMAEEGGKNPKLTSRKTLRYRVLNEQGKKDGVPIPSSHIYNKPGHKFLESLFVKNETLRAPYKVRIKNAIDLVLNKSKARTMEEFQEALRKDKIQLDIRKTTEGKIYGLTYVDHFNKCVFNGSDLDSNKQYSAAGISKRIEANIAKAESLVQTVPVLERQSQQQSLGKKPSVTIPQRQQQPTPLPAKQDREREKPTAQPLPVKGSEKAGSLVEAVSFADMSGKMVKELTKVENGEPNTRGLKQKKKRKKKRIHL